MSSLLGSPVQVDCRTCNGRYLVDGEQLAPDEHDGTTCPYCASLNPHALHIREKYGSTETCPSCGGPATNPTEDGGALICDCGVLRQEASQ